MTKINLIGKNVMGYTICEELGSGAFGTVYKVIKTNEAGQFVRALKHISIPTEKQYQFVLNSMGGDVSKTNNYFSQIPQNILSEIKILNALSEKEVPHIIRYYEHDIQISNSPRRYDIFILMQYVIPLENFIQRYKFFVRDVVKLGFDILNGLHFCHSNGIMHRDIKSDNIFVSDNGEYKIGDFGLSKILEDSSKAESLKGTLDFIAPEVYLNGESYTKSVDLYSLGIVLYRLLNYNRNPFLPYFPEQFYIQDEEAAFEKRISGKTPEYPLLGGEHIGGVIVKAISNKTERFQTADEFLSALKTAASDTSADILDEKVNFNIDSSLESFYNFGVKTHEKILSKVVPSSMTQQEDMDDRQRNLVDEHFFESIEGMTDEKISEQESIVNHNQKMSIRDIAPSINKFVFLISFIIFMIGVVVYFIVVPNIYGKVVWMLDWLFMDAQNIIDILYDSNTISPQVNSIIAMRIFWWVWWIAFTVSIFFVGKRLQTKPEPSAVNALLIKKESFLLIQDVNVVLREVKQHRNSEHLNSLICAVKRLEEKISVESDFGYGDYTIIDCENKIVKQLQFLLESASHIETGDFNENINNLNIIVINIHSLLRKRTELKKR